MIPDDGVLDRAQGCLLGQLAGDALGSLVEFQSPQAIRSRYPEGVRFLADGGTWDTLAGQPTDDSELALLLARTLAAEKKFNDEAVARAYASWYESGPNAAIAGALLGAVHGRKAIPAQWEEKIVSCRPEAGKARHPRPPALWPVDALDLAERLIY